MKSCSWATLLQLALQASRIIFPVYWAFLELSSFRSDRCDSVTHRPWRSSLIQSISFLGSSAGVLGLGDCTSALSCFNIWASRRLQQTVRYGISR
ncbi:uncharacterized protein B0H18DRAFT_691107 [Fomitopsis serialis]|uniref:uncharacterized protein n=1 Tax=Fomitopsis serialis TaxID=139415 RepID=UPI00200778AF|nr:uncharacterized protein B0H18DRAFT_691107 [Neoantrodia serialis]KAH9917608.1 hypothetical protein B0H18DRAFT_691107 [Neoantrodia serialis]